MDKRCLPRAQNLPQITTCRHHVDMLQIMLPRSKGAVVILASHLMDKRQNTHHHVDMSSRSKGFLGGGTPAEPSHLRKLLRGVAPMRVRAHVLDRAEVKASMCFDDASLAERIRAGSVATRHPLTHAQVYRQWPGRTSKATHLVFKKGDTRTLEEALFAESEEHARNAWALRAGEREGRGQGTVPHWLHECPPVAEADSGGGYF